MPCDHTYRLLQAAPNAIKISLLAVYVLLQVVKLAVLTRRINVHSWARPPRSALAAATPWNQFYSCFRIGASRIDMLPRCAGSLLAAFAAFLPAALAQGAQPVPLPAK